MTTSIGVATMRSRTACWCCSCAPRARAEQSATRASRTRRATRTTRKCSRTWVGSSRESRSPCRRSPTPGNKKPGTRPGSYRFLLPSGPGIRHQSGPRVGPRGSRCYAFARLSDCALSAGFTSFRSLVTRSISSVAISRIWFGV